MNTPLSTRQDPPHRLRWSRLAGVAFGAVAMVGIGSALALRHPDLAPNDPTVTVGQAGTAPLGTAPPGTPQLGTPPLSAAPPQAEPPRTQASSAAGPGPDAAAMVAKLEQRLRQQPQDREGWVMLARAYGVMGRDQDVVDIYRRLVALSPSDNASRAQAHADLGRAIGKANGRKLTPEADRELHKALELDPGNVMAHALLGRTDLERGDAAGAKRHWQKALEGVDSGHPFAQQLRQSIELADNMANKKAATP
ncbi:cytochrome c-type biogenesis protein CcmH [Roseateles sp. YR242]|uniref:tetratricopeptide repeat protein n=1 Tax=Roseateles sp. YR242 TaxID=1855305 RepID=UPI0008C31451|nr:hypothetical protein [Roseateles sp. YR242]SEL22978.1 cytochrome c-type biogenesis protein CcmH [Roseateles sp. YR242]